MVVGIIGLGLIGGSMAIDLRRRGFADKVYGVEAESVNAAAAGLVDDVIDPADTRKMVIAALELMSSKRDSNPPKKHGNMPL